MAREHPSEQKKEKQMARAMARGLVENLDPSSGMATAPEQAYVSALE